MNYEDIPTSHRCLYIRHCDKCGINQEILTQRDNDAEYETEIYLRCQCGEYLEFLLPVN